MKCPHPGTIQAYLDGELSRGERKQFALHLEECEECRHQLDELSRLEQWTRVAIAESLPPNGQELPPIDVDGAWRRLEERIRDETGTGEQNRLSLQEAAEGGKVKHMATKRERGWRMMDKAYKKWMAGVAAAAVLCGSLAFPDVRAAAKDLLSVFRVDQTEMIKLTGGDLEQMERWLAHVEDGELDLDGIGTFEVENREVQEFGSPELAEQAGIDVPQGPDGYRPAHVTNMPEWTLHVRLNVGKVNRLMQDLKAGVQFDEALDGKTFSFTLPAHTVTKFEAVTSGNVKHFSYSHGKSPYVEAPADVNLDQLRNTFLQLPFIPANVRKQLADIDDWKRTLPLPQIEGRSEKVEVQGTRGLLVRDGRVTILVWQKDGELHRLEVRSDERPATEELVKIANSFQ